MYILYYSIVFLLYYCKITVSNITYIEQLTYTQTILN